MENILLTSRGHIRLADFGLAHSLQPPLFTVSSFSGSKLTLAPEVLCQTNDTYGHGFSVDWWALGVLLHILLTLKPPYWADDMKQVLDFELVCTTNLM